MKKINKSYLLPEVPEYKQAIFEEEYIVLSGETMTTEKLKKILKEATPKP